MHVKHTQRRVSGPGAFGTFTNDQRYAIILNSPKKKLEFQFQFEFGYSELIFVVQRYVTFTLRILVHVHVRVCM